MKAFIVKVKNRFKTIDFGRLILKSGAKVLLFVDICKYFCSKNAKKGRFWRFLGNKNDDYLE